MYTVAREQPLAAVLSPQFSELYCATCFLEIDSSQETEILTCDDCLAVSYCTLKCQRKDWKSCHQFECEILRCQGSSTPMTLTMKLCIRVLLASRSTQTPSFNGAVLEDLETNYKEFRSSPEHNQFLSDVLTIISSSGQNIFPTSLETNKTIGIICSVLCNSFSIINEKRVEPIGSGLYVGVAKHNHSCASTSHVVFEGNQVFLRTNQEEYSKELTISYVSRMLPTSERRKTIRGVHFLTCQCEMCKNEELDLIGLSSKCRTKNCTGFVKGSGNCSVCEKLAFLPFEQSIHSTLNLLDIIENLHKTNQFTTVQELAYLQKLRADYQDILAECNVAILQLDEQIAYCSSSLENVNDLDLDLIAGRGSEHFITRLGIGAPEVTRRLYIGCKCISRISPSKRSVKLVKLIKLAIESSIISHGTHHSITNYLRNL
ncbi:MYND-type domain-containing protein [Caenorhabditis elegans]|uniref:MYND-type domain-containing protein n=1 Tax=Caenorhabditis elegans TaxID=6239 RepID=Q9XV44_CAEEL|nr:MYND-type domain-containing protein [Caenorhabditis elegans]CAB04267.2 MYND-type domain-containing protein [Caenorhabditis elegans]|eukprot:NP_493620.2 SET (trithorax/polycomb) domain containing [Caenorhabditis elegans]